MGLCPNWKKTGGKVQSSQTRNGKRPGGAGVMPGGVGSEAEQELAGGVPASTAVAAGGAKGDHGDGAHAGADRVQPDALRDGVHEANGVGVRRASARAAGEAVAASGAGVGLRVKEDRDVGGGVGREEGGRIGVVCVRDSNGRKRARRHGAEVGGGGARRGPHTGKRYYGTSAPPPEEVPGAAAAPAMQMLAFDFALRKCLPQVGHSFLRCLRLEEPQLPHLCKRG